MDYFYVGGGNTKKTISM